MDINVFLPCRSGSQRVKNKNIKKFHNHKFGLFELKINQLLKIKYIKKIIVSTDDKKIIQFLTKFNHQKIKLDIRPKHLATNKTKTDSLINYVSKLFDKNDHILWTHVTSPFFDDKEYNKAIKLYKINLKKNDSLMGVTKIQDFIFDKNKPINFNPKKIKWPNTQTLKKLYMVNNSIFISSKKNYIKFKNRIGKRPFLMEIEKIKSFDVDWPEDFRIAENIQKNK
jgi:CMP-N-acetylneuraminic acid synthetase